MKDIVKLQEAMARQETEIKEYHQAAEESQRKLKNNIEIEYKRSIDVAIATIE
jgi:endonuclease/exonuclease/phosphatase family metal-dependent hydrolase